MIKQDLGRAGLSSVDTAGRVIDMHSLRHGYISTLVKARTPIKALEKLARHADARTTLNIYAHLDNDDLADALMVLPELSREAPGDSSPGKTSTEASRISEDLSAHFPHATDAERHEMSVSDAKEAIEADAGGRHNPLPDNEKDASRRDLAASDGSAPRRTRTYNPLIKSQLLCQLS